MRVLGRGGLGVVYRALDERTEDEVAVKLLVGASARKSRRATQRFIREFEALAELDHPNVIRVIEAGISDDMPFFSMELVDGLDIKRHVEIYRRSHHVLARSLLRGLDGVVQDGVSSEGGSSDVASETGSEEDSFSDIEPSDEAFDVNAWMLEPDSDVLLGREASSSSSMVGAIGPAPSVDIPFESFASDDPFLDEPGISEGRQPELNDPMRLVRLRELIVQICSALAYVHSRGLVHRDLKPSNILVDQEGDARLMDFGLCKTLADLSDVTDSGQVVGTYRYMSPEQACGEPLDARSDLYSLGVVMYELLCGRPPFIAKSPVRLWEELLEREPPSLFAINPGVDYRMAQVVHSLLRKDPSSRLQTAEEVLDAALE